MRKLTIFKITAAIMALAGLLATLGRTGCGASCFQRRVRP